MSADFKLKNSGVDINNISPEMKAFLKELESYENDIGFESVVTSGYRQGDPKRHGKGEALDFRADDRLYYFLWHTKEGLDLLKKYDLGMLDERSKEAQDEYNSTGPHLHIGKDNTIPTASERYKKLNEAKSFLTLEEVNVADLNSDYHKDIKAKIRKNRLQETPDLLDYDEKKNQSTKDYKVLEKRWKDFNDKKRIYKPTSKEYKESKAELIEAIQDMDLSTVPLKGSIEVEKRKRAKEILKSHKITSPEYQRAKKVIEETETIISPFKKQYLEKELLKRNPRNFLDLYQRRLDTIDNEYDVIFTEPNITDEDVAVETERRNQQFLDVGKRIRTNDGIIDKSPEEVQKEKEKKKAEEDAKAQQSAKEKAEAEKQVQLEKDDEKFRQDMQSYFSNFDDEEMIIKEQYEYDKKDFGSNIPFGAITQGALALRGLAETKTEIPRYDEQISEAMLNYLREQKRISEMGLSPEVEAKMKSDLADAHQGFIDGVVRASGGNRNLVLKHMQRGNVSKLKAINDIAIADAQAKQQAFNNYGRTLEYIENFNQNRDRMNKQLDIQEAQERRQAGAQLASSGFANMLEEIQFAKENGPGSANHQFKQMMNMELFGYIPGLEGNADKVGTYANFKARQGRMEEFNEKVKENNAKKKAFTSNMLKMTPKQREKYLEDKGGINQAFNSFEIPNVSYVDSFQMPDINTDIETPQLIQTQPVDDYVSKFNDPMFAEEFEKNIKAFRP